MMLGSARRGPQSKILGAAGLALAVALCAGAQQSTVGKTAEQVYKNIQVLKDMPADQFALGMHNISGQLGVECVFCHVGHGADFPKDDKPTKITARKMIQMVAEINKNNFGGRPVVTCYTCHQGHPEPVGMFPLPLASFIENFDPPKPVAEPTVDQILARYIQALGGEPALRKITSRIVTGTREVPTGPGGTTPVPAAAEEYSKAPNLTLQINRTPTFTVASGFDGTTAWAQDMTGAVNDVAFPVDQTRIKRTADFYSNFDLKKQYPRMTLRGVERVNDRDAYVVYGYPEGDSFDRLYFDTQTGLLLRKITTLVTVTGNTPYQVDYDDYRDTGSGVKYAFWMRMNPSTARSEPQTQSIFHVQKVQDNAPIEAAKFAKPPSAAVSAASAAPNAAAAPVAAAGAPSAAAAGAAAPAALMAQGLTLYAATYKCGDCHGDSGQGTADAPTLAGIGARMSPQAISAFLQKPSATALDIGMPTVPAGSPDLPALIAYVLSLKP